MSEYELVCIFNPEADSKKLIEKIEGWLRDISAKVKKKEDWQEKELAYKIKKLSKGYYFFWRLEASPSKISHLFPKIKLENDIIRHLLVKTA
jgi:small subunit ribosomal protein S6